MFGGALNVEDWVRKPRDFRDGTSEVVVWLKQAGYVPTGGREPNESCRFWETAWSMRYGHGYLTLRFYKHDYAWDAIVKTGGEKGPGLVIGTCTSLAEMQELDTILRFLNGYRTPEPMPASANV